MNFNLEKLFVDVFGPEAGDVVTILYDLPHDGIVDNAQWQERREMAEEWQASITTFSSEYGLRVNPPVTYAATGAHNADMPEQGMSEGQSVRLEDFIKNTTILISMPEFSASAPLIAYARKYEQLRVASMPMVQRSMERTSLAADYARIAQTCALLIPLFDRSEGIEVSFSSGHQCFFDLSDGKLPKQDDGRLHPEGDPRRMRIMNLPAGEVFVCPNEAADSRTAGQIPVKYDQETAVFVVRQNRIVDVLGEGPMATKMRVAFRDEPAMANVAEVAIGCNDKAAVTGNVLEDEKAGFHWAYGRSEHLGGAVGPDAFSAPDKVIHQDIVYAKGSPIVCRQLDFIFPNGSRQTVITDGILNV